MPTLDAPTIYDQALYGDSLAVPVREPALNTARDLWILGGWGVVLPRRVVRPAPDVQRMISELRAWTQLSARQLATLLGTSHTTVLSAEAGRPLVEARSGDLRRRVTDVHNVVRRIFLLADQNPSATSHILDTAPPSGRSPIDLLLAGEPARAYLSAIDLLRSRPSGLLVGHRPRREGATAPLHE